MLNKFKNILFKVVPYMIVIMFLALITVIVVDNRGRGLKNATYLRYQVCSQQVIMKYVPEKRTPAHNQRCWEMAEKATGVKVDHFAQ